MENINSCMGQLQKDRQARPQVTTSDYKPDYDWLQLRLAITLNIKTFIASYDYVDSLCNTAGENHWKTPV